MGALPTRLIELNPHWVSAWTPDGTPPRHGMGIMFDCPHCVAAGVKSSTARMVRLPIAFQNPIDGGPPFGPDTRSDGTIVQRLLWTRTGETFENLTLTPSVDASATHPGGWHGFLTAGQVR